VDTYAYGVISWEIFARQPFFGNADFFSVMEEWIINGERPYIPNECPKTYSIVIESCWAQNPMDRPSWEWVLVQLNSIQEHIAEYEEKNTEYYLKIVDNYKQQQLKADTVIIPHLDSAETLVKLNNPAIDPTEKKLLTSSRKKKNSEIQFEDKPPDMTFKQIWRLKTRNISMRKPRQQEYPIEDQSPDKEDTKKWSLASKALLRPNRPKKEGDVAEDNGISPYRKAIQRTVSYSVVKLRFNKDDKKKGAIIMEENTFKCEKCNRTIVGQGRVCLSCSLGKNNAKTRVKKIL